MKVRRVARVVVLSPAGSVLLVRYHDPKSMDPSKHEAQTYWVPPGGGVDEDESFERAAVREHQLFHLGELKNQRERYFLARAEPPRVLRNRTKEKIEAIHWWTLDDLRGSTETFFPVGFVELVARVMSGDVPTAPIDIT